MLCIISLLFGVASSVLSLLSLDSYKVFGGFIVGPHREHVQDGLTVHGQGYARAEAYREVGVLSDG